MAHFLNFDSKTLALFTGIFHSKVAQFTGISNRTLCKGWLSMPEWQLLMLALFAGIMSQNHLVKWLPFPE